MSKVVPFDGVTKLPTEPRRVLSSALDANLKSAVVVGWDENGTFWFKASDPDGGDVLWLLQMASKKLLEQG